MMNSFYYALKCFNVKDGHKDFNDESKRIMEEINLLKGENQHISFDFKNNPPMILKMIQSMKKKRNDEIKIVKVG